MRVRARRCFMLSFARISAARTLSSGATKRCGHTARVQPAGGGGDPQGVLRKLAIDRLGFGVMIIAQISDTHIALDTPDADRRIRDFALTIADINGLDPPP